MLTHPALFFSNQKGSMSQWQPVLLHFAFVNSNWTQGDPGFEFSRGALIELNAMQSKAKKILGGETYGEKFFSYQLRGMGGIHPAGQS